MQIYVIMDNLIKYFKDSFGLQLHIKLLNQKQLAKLPLYLNAGYTLYDSTLNGTKLIFAGVKNKMATPDMLLKQGKQLELYFNAVVVFVFDKLESYERKRFINKGIAFAEPNKQIYIPSLLLELNDVARRPVKFEHKNDKLTPPAQCAILYHLQVDSLEDVSFHEIANKLKYSAMTVSRIIKELLNYNLCSVEGNIDKKIQFLEHKQALWEKAKPLLISPVKVVWFTDIPFQNKAAYKTHYSALAEYSMLSEGNQQSFAMSKEDFLLFNSKKKMPELNKASGDYRIEVWNYNPGLLASGKQVDPLSLYLSMQKIEDERTQIALNEMISKIKW